MSDVLWTYSWIALFATVLLLQNAIAWQQQRSRRAAWARAATRLGLQLSGSGWALMLTGLWQGVAVEICQRVEYRYKSEPLLHIELRARLPEHATAPELGDATVVDGWLERHLAGSVDTERIEALIEPLVRAVRAGKTGA